ncbi:hypothetical protein [Ensifer sp.]|jgi:hypothetical protein|uniref:hypothetical protein n=1 Tax=Ensifer sp. TaxID=1872086 RepID=UPI002E0F755B|nr:hypothetical protein [Ensifer sp.]
MTSFPRSPYILKCGIVLLDPTSFRMLRTIALQYNPDQLSRTLQVQSAGGDGGGRSEPLRFKGPPVETFKIEAEIDATDQLEHASAYGGSGDATKVGIFPQLCALEALITPASSALARAERFLLAGSLEIAPAEAPLALFVWSRQRVVPVRVTEFSAVEEAFDTELNPIRARVTLGLRTLSVNDLPFGHRGAALFMAYLKNKETLAARAIAGSLSALGLTELP